LLRGSPTERAAFYKSGLNDGWLNINQVCAWENLPPVEGGDVNRVQMQNVPLTMAPGLGTINATLPAE
jgi:phage portal protein BeeE